MKTKKHILISIALFFSIVELYAQNPVTTLQHAGETQVFYGITSFTDAYNASATGDTLYLSSGYFNAPASIAKGITIIGSGHFPDSTGVILKRTTINSSLSIMQGADSLHLEGLYIKGSIGFQADASINYTNIIRCYVGNLIDFQSSSEDASKNYCTIEECLILGSVYFYTYGTNLVIRKCILSKIYNITSNALIENNILIYDCTSYCYSSVFNEVSSSVIKNNIIIRSNDIFYGTCDANYFANNLCICANGISTANSNENNYIGIPQEDIFENFTSDFYTSDYHLKNPELYIGTDSTQVGIYGGDTPFKTNGAPSNPQILIKGIGEKTDANGNLQINFTVKAQNN